MIKKNDGVMAAQRALSLLQAFSPQDRTFSLADLSRHVELDKATVLRLARTLAGDGFLVQNTDLSWRLGPAVARLGAVYQETFVFSEVVAPYLKDLSQATRESAAIHVREGDKRVCLIRHESDQPIRHHTRTGDLLPMDRGAPGRVILAFEGAYGSLYDKIRARGYHLSEGERDPEVASTVAPLFKDGNTFFGALVVTGPAHRFTPEAIHSHLIELKRVGRLITLSLGGDPSVYELPLQD